MDREFENFISVFNSEIGDARLQDGVDSEDGLMHLTTESAFTEVFVSRLQELGQLADFELLYFENQLGSRKASAKLNGYSISDEDSQLDLLISICDDLVDEEDLQSVTSTQLSNEISKALQTFKQIPYHDSLEESSPTYDMAELFYSLKDSINRVRVIAIVNGKVSKHPKVEQIENFPEIIIDIWDIERLFRASASGLTYESIPIDVEDMCGKPLPCISGVQTSDDYCCHFSIFPGEFLYSLYHQYGPRLLELNVRSFLQARGKVNRGIRDTLKNEPGFFLAYNNGISATVEKLDVREMPDGGLGIYAMEGLQIVNGGQTTASIHRAKDRDKLDLKDVSVQVKITVVGEDKVDDLVPKISRYSNTQNKVSETDFSANHPFHVLLQKLSEKIWTPGQTSRWFYERARGQWEVARVREGTTPAKTKVFDTKTPKKQKIDKILTAKAMNSWDELPDIVSKGAQKNFVSFMNLIDKRGATWEPDEKYYKDLVSKVILFNKAKSIANKHKFPGYRANAITYTVALLAYRTAHRVDFESIWKNQSVSEALECTLKEWMPQVWNEFVNTAPGNVTEWCKKKECWAHIQSLNLQIPSEFEDELAEGQALPTVGRGTKRAGKTELTSEDRERQAKLTKHTAEELVQILKWGEERGDYENKVFDILSTLIGYASLGWKNIPSPNQTKNVVQLIDEWESSKLGSED